MISWQQLRGVAALGEQTFRDQYPHPLYTLYLYAYDLDIVSQISLHTGHTGDRMRHYICSTMCTR